MTEAHASTEQDPIPVFLPGDHEVVRRGPAGVLDAGPDLCVPRTPTPSGLPRRNVPTQIEEGLSNCGVGKRPRLSEKTVPNDSARLLASSASGTGSGPS